jgi:transcriptional regulator with XRE-family HTH domain
MTNERLRAAITSAGLNLQTFSEQVGVDPKTVERWITKDRNPHRTHRMSAAAVLGKSDGFLWPSTESDRISRSATEAELVRLYPSRGAIDADMWLSLVEDANESIDLLAYAGSFLHDAIPGFVDRLASRSRSGVRVRLLFGRPRERIRRTART